MRIPLKLYVALLAKYMRPQRAKVIVRGALLLIQVGVQLANPQVLRAFIDRAAAGATVETLAAIAALLGLSDRDCGLIEWNGGAGTTLSYSLCRRAARTRRRYRASSATRCGTIS